MKEFLQTVFRAPRAKLFVLATLVIFAMDYLALYGINGSAFYAPLLLFTVFSQNSALPLFIGGVASGLLLLEMWAEAGVSHLNLQEIINKTIEFITIWVAVYVVQSIYRMNEKFHAIWRQHSTGLILVNQKSEIVQTSPAIQDFFGYSADELKGQLIETLIPQRFHHQHVQHRQAYHAKPHARPMGVGLDLYARRKDGSEFPVEVSLSPFRSDTGEYVIVFVIDNTIRKRQEDILISQKKELENLTQALQVSNRELENFAYISSHDLQEPLRKIRAFGDLLEEPESGNLSDVGKSYLKRMQQSATRMQQLIRDLLEFSRLSTQASSFATVDLNHSLNETLADIDLAIKESKAIIEVSDLPEIEADATQIRQLFQNLLSNAIKFRQEDKPPLINIEARRSAKGADWIELRIQDNGIGFDEKYADRIFFIFQRLEGRKYEGSGIGLAICQKIVHRHGGEIVVKSKVNHGSTFIITLPIHQ